MSFSEYVSNRMFWDLYFHLIKLNLIFNSPRYIPSTIRHFHSNDHKLFCKLLENVGCSSNNF